ncbi:MAG TPA: hypothetical protein VFJ72_13080 [Rubrobacteraceae bacterium]|nr:hypothetical protein [Rubrobacteraceae bacterium]
MVHNGGGNGASGVLAEAVQNSYEAFVDGVAAAQARNMNFALGWIGSSTEMLKAQAEINLRVMEAVAEQSRRQREVSRTLVEESVRTFVDFAYGPLPGTAEPEAGGDENLPIDDFDRLTVEEIGSRLRGLDAREVEEIKTYEKRHKNRAMLMERLERALT